MSSPLAEAFLLVTLNNCYETPSNSQQEEYRLIIQHILYETKQMAGKGNDVGTIQLQPKENPFYSCCQDYFFRIVAAESFFRTDFNF